MAPKKPSLQLDQGWVIFPPGCGFKPAPRSVGIPYDSSGIKYNKRIKSHEICDPIGVEYRLGGY